MKRGSISFRIHQILNQPGLLGLIVLLCAGCQGAKVVRSTQEFPEQTGFVQRHIQVDGETKSVWIFIPYNYSQHRLQPAILFLHGLFEQGDGGTNVLSAGLGPVIARNPAAWPFITIFPQSDGTWEGPARDRLAMAVLDDALLHYQIDPSRVILAGLSYGGLGVWEIGARHRDRFAALVPVNGFRAMEFVEPLAGMPIWAFASRDDIFVSAQNSIEMCQAIAARGGQPRLTQFAGGQHDCWPQVVAQPDLIPWMLQQRRNPLQASLNSYDRIGRQSTGRLRAWTDQ